MKLIHLSDLHLGKRVNEFSMIEDQKYILKKITNVIDEEKPEAVIIAGDVYDKSVPSAEAVELFDDFIVRMAGKVPHVFIISGNHDSAERLAFGSRLMDRSGVHFSPVYSGEVKPVSLEDEHGIVDVYMLPFIKPVSVRRFFPYETVESYTDAVRAAVRNMNIDENRRNVLVTHQFVTDAKRSESEEISVGGSDNVDASAFEGFDYVALGHIHGPQNCGTERIRYCGTPLKYSFSEKDDVKSVTVVELGADRDFKLRTVPLIPQHDMIELKGKYDELMARSYYSGTTYETDYTRIILTDEEDIPDAVTRLRNVYKNLMKLDYDNTRTRYNAVINAGTDVDNKSPLELFEHFYEMQNGKEMTAEQQNFVSSLIEKIWEDEG